MAFFSYLFQDWKRNRGNVKARFVLFSFRLAQKIQGNKFLLIIGFPHLIWYRFFIEWIMGIELPWKTKVGENFSFDHGQSLVVNYKSVIGKNCLLRHCTTIGTKQLKNGKHSDAPVLGNNVDVGAHSCIIGPITIGNNVIIGAGSVVIKSVPDNSIVVGNPARIIN